MSTKNSLVRGWLVATNAAMMLGWARVLLALAIRIEALLEDRMLCNDYLGTKTRLALILSFLELLNALAGFTRSKPPQVLLFALVRAGVEVLVTPQLHSQCSSWTHIATVAFWSMGDTIRFGCFMSDTVFTNSTWPKAVRYTVGPLLFPLGAVGEMVMVLELASRQTNTTQKITIYAAAALWPLGFYPLFTQLLRQKQKFFRSLAEKKKTS